MQTTTPTTNFHNVRVHLVNDSAQAPVLALASVGVAQLVMITQIRVIQGKYGVFISMPQKKLKGGEYVDVAFPLNKTTREEISALILAEYESQKALFERPAVVA